MSRATAGGLTGDLDAGLANHLARQHETLITALSELVRIPSVIDEGSGGFPFGAAIDLALRKTLDIAAGLGMHTYYDPEGYYGFAECGADASGDNPGAEMVGVLGHVDVVPAGNREEWKHSPFEPVVEDGRMYGRGTQDDKGPLLAALFAARALCESGLPLRRRIRIIFGTDEELLWRGVKRYVAREELPTLGFSPDAQFPLIYAEKGLLQAHLEGPGPSGLVLRAGEALNAVPDAALYGGDRRDELAARLDFLGYLYERSPAGILVRGVAAHAQSTENGRNAICRLAVGLDGIGIDSPAIRFLAREIGEDPFATRIFGRVNDEPTGALRFNIGTLEMGARERIGVDVRIPVTVEKERIVERLRAAAAAYGLVYREYDWMAPLYVPRDHPLVRTLLGVYREVSGDTISEPLTSGGATYARAAPNLVAFGAVFPGQPTVAHLPNEYIVLDELFQAMKIYAHALYELAG